MDAKKIKHIRQRLSTEYENLIESNNRNRRAAEEITVENTEDEGDLATISHNRDLLYNLHEGSFARLRSIEEAMEALDRFTQQAASILTSGQFAAAMDLSREPLSVLERYTPPVAGTGDRLLCPSQPGSRSKLWVRNCSPGAAARLARASRSTVRIRVVIGAVRASSRL